MFLCICAPFKVHFSHQTALFQAVPAVSIAGDHDVGIGNTNWTSQQLTGITSRHCAKKRGSVLLGNASRIFRWGLIWQATEDWRCTAIYSFNHQLLTLSNYMEFKILKFLKFFCQLKFYSKYTEVFCLIPMRSVKGVSLSESSPVDVRLSRELITAF